MTVNTDNTAKSARGPDKTAQKEYRTIQKIKKKLVED
jgi:hypothetical protein